MFDTHCHLNFKAFAGRVEEIISNAKKSGIAKIVVPGTDLPSSLKAAELAGKYEGVYAAVGIHPHHVFQINQNMENGKSDLSEIEKLLLQPKVVAIGEVGMDKHYYNKTKYPDYKLDESFIKQQEKFLREQIDLAIKYKKSIILHNWEAKKELLNVLTDYRKLFIDHRCVFHCCEPDKELLDFAIQHKIFIGVDGDVTFWKEKQEFIKTVPRDRLVLETDSPFLLPAQLRVNNKNLPAGRQGRPANEPKNLKIIADFIANLIEINLNELNKITEENSRRLFQLS